MSALYNRNDNRPFAVEIRRRNRKRSSGGGIYSLACTFIQSTDLGSLLRLKFSLVSIHFICFTRVGLQPLRDHLMFSPSAHTQLDRSKTSCCSIEWRFSNASANLTTPRYILQSFMYFRFILVLLLFMKCVGKERWLNLGKKLRRLSGYGGQVGF